jgi:hypothetical protein
LPHRPFPGDWSTAFEVAEKRSGNWFDPALVAALRATQLDTDFWRRLQSSDLVAELNRWEPNDSVLLADEDCIDRVAEAFAKVVDTGITNGASAALTRGFHLECRSMID